MFVSNIINQHTILKLYNTFTIKDQIIKHPIIQKRLEFFKANGNGEEYIESSLLQTIRVPKNLLFLK